MKKRKISETLEFGRHGDQVRIGEKVLVHDQEAEVTGINGNWVNVIFTKNLPPEIGAKRGSYPIGHNTQVRKDDVKPMPYNPIHTGLPKFKEWIESRHPEFLVEMNRRDFLKYSGATAGAAALGAVAYNSMDATPVPKKLDAVDYVEGEGHGKTASKAMQAAFEEAGHKVLEKYGRGKGFMPFRIAGTSQRLGNLEFNPDTEVVTQLDREEYHVHAKFGVAKVNGGYQGPKFQGTDVPMSAGN